MGDRVYYVPFSPAVLETMRQHSTIIVANGKPRTIDEQPSQEHAPAVNFVNLPVTIANDLVGCGAECEKVEVQAGEVVDWLYVDLAGCKSRRLPRCRHHTDQDRVRYCRRRATGETYVFAYLTRDVQDRVEAIYDDIVFRGTMEADVDAALERFIVANDHPLFHGEDECDSCHHFFGVHGQGCTN